MPESIVFTWRSIVSEAITSLCWVVSDLYFSVAISVSNGSLLLSLLWPVMCRLTYLFITVQIQSLFYLNVL